MSKPIYKWSEWPEPQWLKYKKHIPPTQMKWDELVKSTADGPALYHPNIDIQAHEMRAVKSGLISQVSTIFTVYIPIFASFGTTSDM